MAKRERIAVYPAPVFGVPDVQTSLKQGHGPGLKTDEADNLIHQNTIAGSQPDRIQMLAIACAYHVRRTGKLASILGDLRQPMVTFP